MLAIAALFLFSQFDRASPTGSPAPARQASAAPERKDAVHYRVVKEWRIPNGGFGRVIVSNPAQRTETGMRALGDQRREDTRRDRNAFIFIYDDERAASLRDAAFEERLGAKDLKFHDTHMIGTYMRNINTGFHELNILLQGVEGNSIQVKY